MKQKFTRFDELIRDRALQIGDGYRAKNDELGGSGPIFLRAAYLQDQGFVLDDPDRFNASAPHDFGPKAAQLNDVVITTKGNSTGRVGRIREPQVGSIYSPHLSYWRSLDAARIDQTFLYYWSRSGEFRRQLDGMAASTDMAPYLSLRDQLRLRISLPQIQQQVAIGKVLSALDDKIDLNRLMNETLEAMARAIFKEWFIDFGPTRAKMAGRAAYLAPDIWALFPDRLDDELKPTNWNYVPLSAVASELRRGISPTYIENGGVCVLNQKCIRNGQVDFGPSRRHDISRRTVDGRLLMAGDILVNSTGVGTLGRVAQLWEADRPVVVDSHVTVVRPNVEHVSTYYLGLDLTGREAQVEALGEGSTGQTELSRARLGSLPLLRPPKEIQTAFDSSIAPLIKRVSSNRKEQRILAEVRDLLIPKLMSGEIRLKEAESIAEIAA